MGCCEPSFGEPDEKEGDDGDIELYPDGILGASEECFDVQVLLDPFEEQLDLPTLLVKCGDLLGRAAHVVRDQNERSFSLSCDRDFSQLSIVKRVYDSTARALVANFQKRVRDNLSPRQRQRRHNVPPFGIFLQPRNEDRSGLHDPLPKAVLIKPFVEDISSVGFDGGLSRKFTIANFGRGQMEGNGHVRFRVLMNIELETPHPAVRFRPSKTQVPQGDG